MVEVVVVSVEVGWVGERVGERSVDGKCRVRWWVMVVEERSDGVVGMKWMNRVGEVGCGVEYEIVVWVE